MLLLFVRILGSYENYKSQVMNSEVMAQVDNVKSEMKANLQKLDEKYILN
jgi:hypothetical protein